VVIRRRPGDLHRQSRREATSAEERIAVLRTTLVRRYGIPLLPPDCIVRALSASASAVAAPAAAACLSSLQVCLRVPLPWSGRHPQPRQVWAVSPALSAESTPPALPPARCSSPVPRLSRVLAFRWSGPRRRLLAGAGSRLELLVDRSDRAGSQTTRRPAHQPTHDEPRQDTHTHRTQGMHAHGHARTPH
jgi:hypothetical protein